MAGRFEGKVALVTGAGSGIGRATSLAFVREGARVVVSDINSEGGEETVSMIRHSGGEAAFIHANVTRADQVEAMVAKTVEAYGRLDAAFNNAGIATINRVPIHEYPEDEWDRIVDIDLKGVWLCMKYEIPHMLRQGSGAIVNTSSIAGLVAMPGRSAYVASKHGVIGLTKTAALEYAKQGIRVNAVSPGYIRTPMVEPVIAANPALEKQIVANQPIGRLGTPEEIAEAVLWLSSDAASFVTGHTMAVDGAYVAQ